MSLDQTPDGMATRRSPRSIERFCRGLKLEDLAFEQTALLLSLAQLSGWSADRIALTILDLYRVKVTAEQVWNFHGKWVTVRDGSQDLDKVEKDIAEYMILEAGITLAPPKPAYRWRWLGRPLSETIEPKTILFPEIWSPFQPHQPLCPGYDKEARIASRNWLLPRKMKNWSKLSPTEKRIVAGFGGEMKSIMCESMGRWVSAWLEKIRTDSQYRRLVESAQTRLIFEYLQFFHEQYEDYFGHMEEVRHSALGVNESNGLVIRSTGYGAKALLGLMMADRVCVAKCIREHIQNHIGFVQLNPLDFEDEDERLCAICQYEMGVENLDGTGEACIEMTICCGHCFGENCLKKWFSEYNENGRRKTTCPFCRFKLPNDLLQDFFGVDNEDIDGYNSDDLNSAEYQRIVDLDNPDLSQEPQLDPDQESQMGTSIEVAVGDDPMEIDVDDFDMEG